VSYKIDAKMFDFSYIFDFSRNVNDILCGMEGVYGLGLYLRRRSALFCSSYLNFHYARQQGQI